MAHPANLALALALAASLAVAQPAPLSFPPPLAPGIAAFPKLTADDPASQSINANLTAQETADLPMIRSCLSREGSDWARWIDTPLPGPRFFSFRGTDDFYCEGAAHPNQYIFTHTYDLETGLEIDWSRVLPAAYTSPAYPGYPFTENVFASPALTRLYLDHYARPAGDACTEIMNANDLAFRFWLDGTEGALMILPDNLSHAARACGDIIAIPAAELAALGAAPALIHALSPQ